MCIVGLIFRAAGLHSRLLGAFVATDKDGSGSVSKRELYKALQAAGLDGVAYESVCLYIYIHK